MTTFFCERLETDVDLTECTVACDEYAECKASNYYAKVLTLHQRETQTFSAPRKDAAGNFPNPTRVSEIQEAIKKNWPEQPAL